MKQLVISLCLLVMSMNMVFAESIKYHIDISNPEHHLADVRLQFLDVPKGRHFDVKMPQWRTGLYKILDLANGVREFNARNAQGEDLAWKKIDKHTWRVELKGTGVQVSYELYANLLGRRARHIDDSHAYLDASAVFMFNEGMRNQPIEISLNVPDQWRSVSGMPSKGDHRFTASNFDVLIDSPIETGIHDSRKFEVNGLKYELVVWGRGNYDINQMADDLAKLVETGSAIWSDYPYERYVFMVHATSGERGATEHLNSTIIQRYRNSFADRKDYLGFLSTASHEFVHTWNVKAYRPKGLVPYDYDKENYSTLLWMSEGSTSYFQNQLLLRSDLMTTKEFFEGLAKSIVSHRHRPGTSQQSVAESSFDTWIDEGGDRANNASVNIYREGFMVSWLLDSMIQAETDGKYSYRDVHNELYKQFSIPKDFDEQDVQDIVAKLVGKDVSAWWQKNVHGHLDIDFDSMLAQVGLKLTPSAKEPKPWLGLKASDKNGLNRLYSVERNSPAWLAGFTPTDDIVAINDMRVKGGKLDSILDQYEPGDVLTITYFRRDQLSKKQVTLSGYNGSKYKIENVDNPTDTQKQYFKAWLGVDYPEAKKD